MSYPAPAAGPAGPDGTGPVSIRFRLEEYDDLTRDVKKMRKALSYAATGGSLTTTRLTWYTSQVKPKFAGKSGQESTSRTRKNDGTDPTILAENLLRSSGKLSVKVSDCNVRR